MPLKASQSIEVNPSFSSISAMLVQPENAQLPIVSNESGKTTLSICSLSSNAFSLIPVTPSGIMILSQSSSSQPTTSVPFSSYCKHRLPSMAVMYLKSLNRLSLLYSGNASKGTRSTQFSTSNPLNVSLSIVINEGKVERSVMVLRF